MTPPSDLGAALSSVSASLLRPYDVVELTTGILVDAVAVSGAASGGIVIRRPGQEHLNVLAATSRSAQELELYQTQVEEGPCFDAVSGGEVISVEAPQIGRRWPQVGPEFERAGYVRVHATPLVWHTETIGALNLFWTDRDAPVSEAALQVFADMTTLAIVHAAPLPTVTVLERVRTALAEKALLEQVTGVLAHQRGIDPERAHDVLLAIAEADSTSVLATATRLLRRPNRRDRRAVRVSCARHR